MKKLLLTILAAMASVCYADPPAPFPIEINSQSRVAPEVWTFRNNVRTFRATFKDGTNAVSLVGATPFMSWSTNELASGVVTSSWALVDSGTSGMADFTFTAAALNYATQTNVYEIGVAGSVAVYNRGRFLIKPSPYATGTNMPVFTTNQNLTGYSFTGQPWIENVTLTTGGSAYVWSGTGTTRNLNVPTGTLSGATGSGVTTNITVGGGSSTRLSVSNGATANPVLNFNAAGLATGTPLYVEAFTGSVGSAAGFATGTPLYVEAFTGSVGSIAGLATGTPLYVEAFTGSVGTIAGLATGTPLYVESFTGSVGSISGLATGTPLYVEADTNAIARLVASSNSLAARIVVTESYTGRAAVALSSSVWALAESTTGYYSRVNGNLLDARLVVVESYTSRIVGVEAYTSRVVALEGYTATVVAIQGQVNTNLTRLGALETNTTIVAGYVGTNDAYDITSTNTRNQRVLAGLYAGDFVNASSNLTVAGTNAVGAELIVNGTFTGSEAGFLLASCSWDSGNKIYVAPGAAATITYTNAAFGPGVYQLVWTSDIDTGTNPTLFRVVLGGTTQSLAYIADGTYGLTFGIRTTQYLSFAITPGTNTYFHDTVSLKRDVVGDAWIARDIIAGRDVYASNAVVAGSVTAGSFSGGTADFELIDGFTTTNPMTNTSFVYFNEQVVTGTAAFRMGVEFGNYVIITDAVSPTISFGDLAGPYVAVGGFTPWYSQANSQIEPTLWFAKATGFTFAARFYTNRLELGGSISQDTSRIYLHGTEIYGANNTLVLTGNTFRGDGSGLTNLPAAATTAGVNGILVDATNTLTANVDFDDSVEIDPYQNGSNGVSWSINSGSIASGKLAAAVISWVGSKGTGSVGSVAAIATNVPQAAAIKVLASSDGGTNYYLKADDTGSATGNVFSVTSTAPWLVVSSRYGPEVVLAPTSTPLFSEANVPTNAFTPTALAVGAGDTCIVVRTGANLFSLVATSTPTTITFDSTWTTGHVGTCLIELTAGTNSIAFPTSVVHNVGRSSSTNLTIQTTGVTELMFQKPIGSIWHVIQLTP